MNYYEIDATKTEGSVTGTYDLFGYLKTPEGYRWLIEGEEGFFYIINEVTLGDFIISVFLLFILGFLILDFIFKRIVPVFVRFWR